MHAKLDKFSAIWLRNHQPFRIAEKPAFSKQSFQWMSANHVLLLLLAPQTKVYFNNEVAS
jgi:hypothetical protein